MENCLWPGAYSFKSDLKTILVEIKKQIDSLLLKINEIDEKY